MLKNIFQNFCSDTSIHGFAYVSKSKSHKVEKFFWILSILTSFILTGILIRQLLIESQKNPTVIYKDNKAIKIEDLYFPAVSICPGLIFKTACNTVIDYEEVKSRLLRHETNISELSFSDLKLLQVGSLVARDHFLSDNFPSLSIPTDDFFDFYEQFNLTFVPYYIYKFLMKEVRPYAVMPPSNFNGYYANKYAVFLKQFDTEFGPCFTFNSPQLIDIYNANVTSNVLTNERNTELIAFFDSGTTSLGKIVQLENVTYPVKGNMDGFQLNIRVYHRTCNNKVSDAYNHFDNAVLRNFDKVGLKVVIHDPYEIIPSSENHFTVNKEDEILLAVTPVISGIDSSLVDEKLENRRCYLEDERQLEFFKVYTKKNCEHECLTQMTLKSCKCVQFFMVRNQTTRICGISDEKCFSEVEKQFNEDKSVCRCYDPCDNIKYEVKLQKTESEALFRNDPAVNVRLSVDSVYATRRRKSITFIDFMSFIGGLLGLFAGFSFLSAAEFIYHFAVHPLTTIKLRNSSRVEPLGKFKQKSIETGRITKFVMEFLQNSSIHSLGYIGKKSTKVIERLVWIFLLAVSLTLSFLAMREVFQKYWNNNIVLKFANSPINIEEIPLPALTIVPRVANVRLIDFNEKLRSTGIPNVKKLHGQVSLITRIARDISEVFEYNSTSDFVYILKLMTAENDIPFDIYSAIWNRVRNISFAEVMTLQFLGRAFNLMEQSKLLNMEKVSRDFYYTYGCEKNCGYPLKSAFGEGYSVEFNIWNLEVYTQKFFTIHPSNELPLIGFREGLQMRTFYDVLITPIITKAEDDLKSLSIKSRNCYFDGERKLKYFKIYTQKNCEMECLAHVVFEVCTCIPYNYIRNSQKDICDAYSTNNCILTLENIKANEYDHLYESHGVCQCLPPCNEVKYSYEVYKNKFDRNLSISNSLIQMRWKDSEYYAMIRVQEFKLVDFFSYAGGILGLFAGISVLSIFEIFYFLTLRLATDLVRN